MYRTARFGYTNTGWGWGAGRSRLVEVACDRSSLLAACVAEAVRLRAPGIAVRMAACCLPMPAGPGTTVRVHKVAAALARLLGVNRLQRA